MIAANRNIHIDQGTDAVVRIVWKNKAGVPWDVSQFTFTMSLSQYAGPVIDTLETGDGITNNAGGLILIQFSAEDTEDYPEVCRYDIMVQNTLTNQVDCLCRGALFVRRTVTRLGGA